MYSDEELKAMSLDELRKEFESAEKFRFFLNMKDHMSTSDVKNEQKWYRYEFTIKCIMKEKGEDLFRGS